jgi:predicted outer membrane repeat protein
MPALAATFNIATGDVTGLTNAINMANGNTQDDTIVLAVGGTYTLTAALPPIGADGGHKLTIQGNGATIDGNSSFRIFVTQSGSNVAISGLTMANGAPGGHGGAILANSQESAASTLTIDHCTFNGNRGDYGGAIFNDGFNDASFPAHTVTLNVTNSTFSNNTGNQYGGAIWNQSGNIVMNVSNCTFSQNSATAVSAGAIQVDGSAGTITASITNCTFTQNSAAQHGGAINVDGQGGFDTHGNPTSGSATLTVTNCTFSGNTAKWGGGIAMDGSNDGGTTGNATVKVDSCTFSGNFSTTLGDAIYLSETTSGTTVLQIGNTILASGDPDFNISTDNISGGTVTVTSNGYNLSDDAAGGDATTAPGGLLNHLGDQRNTDPLLDPAGLTDNGGPTQTIALQSTSPALDKGKSNTVSATSNDQRGEPRPFDDPNVTNASGGDGSDIGAYEADVRTISSTRVGNDFQITFTTILGHTYEVQSRTSLSSGTWSTVNNTTPPPPITGTGGIVQVTVTNAFAFSSAFYRLHQLP